MLPVVEVNGLSSERVHEIAANAYVYLYPLVTMDVTRRQSTNIEAGRMPGRGPMNEFVHVREFPAADFKMVVRPNFDTLYSSAWLDLRDGPIVVSTGADADGRYYALPMYDMWTDAFAVPGRRTSGTGAGNWALVPPGWVVESLPDGVDRIDAPTPIVWVIGRTQTNGPADYPNVHAMQERFALTRLGDWGHAGGIPHADFVPDPAVDMTTPPLDQVDGMSGQAYFDHALDLMAVHPAHLTDGPLLMQMGRLGLAPGAKVADLASPVQEAIAAAPSAAQQQLRDSFPRIAKIVNGWQMNTDSMGVYGNFYLKRAIVAMVGLGANNVDDAIYPVLMADADGRPVSGDHRYVLHFEADELPPVEAFWSVTMYDEHGFQAANAIDRFAIGDRDPLRYNADGSLDLYVQHDSPGPDREANWLPAPRGPLGVTMRLYEPKTAVLQGGWNPPAMRKV
jgi:hypothetical protein